ncbi:MAG: hypothetical protein Q4F11_05995 [Eubacteriales bacterium]|nr:hypothetical protein [Eubacteriales bacterium]
MNRRVVIENPPLTYEDYAEVEKHGGFSNKPIPQSDKSKEWNNEFWELVGIVNDLMNMTDEERNNFRQEMIKKGSSDACMYMVDKAIELATSKRKSKIA